MKILLDNPIQVAAIDDRTTEYPYVKISPYFEDPDKKYLRFKWWYGFDYEGTITKGKITDSVIQVSDDPALDPPATDYSDFKSNLQMEVAAGKDIREVHYQYLLDNTSLIGSIIP